MKIKINKNIPVLLALYMLPFLVYAQNKLENKKFLSFYSIDDMRISLSNFDKEENYFFGAEINFSLFDPNYFKNIKNIDSSYYSVNINKPIIFSKLIHSYEEKGYTFKVFANIEYEQGEDDQGGIFHPHYKQWIKSYTKENIIIDSLQLVLYKANHNNFCRILSKIETPDEIQVDFNYLHFNEIQEPFPTPNDYKNKTKSYSKVYKVLNGRFVFQNISSSPLFYDGYNWGDINDITDNECWSIIKNQEFDANNDGTEDGIFFLKNVNNCKNNLTFDLIIAFSDIHHVYQYKKTENLDLDYNKYNVIKYENGLKIKFINGPNKDLEFYFTYKNYISKYLQNVFRLEKVYKNGQVIVSIKNEKNFFLGMVSKFYIMDNLQLIEFLKK